MRENGKVNLRMCAILPAKLSAPSRKTKDANGNSSPVTESCKSIGQQSAFL